MRKVVFSCKIPPTLRDRLHAWHVRTRVPKAIATAEALTAYLDAAEREAAAPPATAKKARSAR